MIARLAFDPPRADPGAIEIALAEQYGLNGTLRRLHGERDLNHCLYEDGGAHYLVRVGTQAEAPIRSAMQAAALEHVAMTDPDCPVPRLVRTTSGGALGKIDLPSGSHPMTVMSWCPGAPVSIPPGAALAEAIGSAVGRLSRALRGFFHPGAGEYVAWDVRRRVALDPDIRGWLSAEVADLAGPVLAWAERELPSALAECRHQIVHGDSHMSNILVDGTEVTGIVDLGDMLFGPVVQNLATTISSLQRAGAQKAAEAAVVRGHQGQDPLSAHELDLLPGLVRFRHVTALVFYDALVTVGAERPAYAGRARARLLELAPVWAMPSPRPVRPPGELLARRQCVTDPFRHLFHRDPPAFVRGEGVSLVADDGRRFLDLYNNVASVGHNHPRVVEAIVAQTRRHTLNTRYLDETVVDYAERLTALFPDGLDAAVFTCTGSEANDLALRICRHLTGHEGLIAVTSAYHGNTDLLRRLTSGTDPATAIVPVPTGPNDLDVLARTCRHLAKTGAGVAAMILDPIFVSSGLFVPKPGLLSEAVRIVRDAGGLVIADEVQSGFFRTGRNMWGYDLHEFVPDLVTLGKPMGNGYPIGGVVYSRDMQPRLASGPRYFNTFGGNPVAAAAGRAVLDVLEEEEIGGHVARMHDVVRAGLERHLGPPSGSGLGWSVALGSSQAADAMVEHLFAHGILAGTAGPDRDRLRIRPPLIFGEAEAEGLFAALAAAPDQRRGLV